MRAILAAALLCCAIGCGGDDPYTGPPELILGTGESSFESLTDGQNIYVVQGPQGGFHLFGSVRTRGIDPGNPEDLSDPGNPTIDFRVFTTGTTEARIDALAAHYIQGLRSGGDYYEMIGRAVILDITDDSELDNVPIRFELELVDSNGVMLSDSRNLIAIPHPNNL
jgi:hypothetical protein